MFDRGLQDLDLVVFIKHANGLNYDCLSILFHATQIYTDAHLGGGIALNFEFLPYAQSRHSMIWLLLSHTMREKWLYGQHSGLTTSTT